MLIFHQIFPARDAVLKIILSDIPQFWLGNIQSRDAFRPTARERKYLMDRNSRTIRVAMMMMMMNLV